MLSSQDVRDPGQWIRQWQKFSQGLAERPGIPGETIFRYKGQDWVGLPFDPRRALPGYIQLYDTVLCWSRPRPAVLDQYQMLTRRFFQSLDLQQYMCAQIQTGGIRAGAIAKVTHITRSEKLNGRTSVCALAGGGSVMATGLALPPAVHEQRVQQLVEQGLDMRPDWPDVRADQYIPGV